MTYPKWVQPDPQLGAVLCVNADEEAAVVADRTPKARTKADAVAEARELGLEFDARASQEAIEALIAAAKQ
jgi:hypothetical protein